MEKKRIIYLSEMGILTAVILLMSFTPLGYFRINALGLEITFLTIPVIIGAIALGPMAGGILGGIFGITSFIQAFGLSPFGAVLLQVNLFGTLITTIAPRIIMGLLTGLVFTAFKNKSFTSFAVTSLCGSVLNTVLFMTSFLLFFANSEPIMAIRGGLDLFSFVVVFVGVNGLVEAIACSALGAAISKVIYHGNRKINE